MAKQKIKYINHKDTSKVGSVVEMDASLAKRLIKEGLAVRTTEQVGKAKAKAPAGKPEAKANSK